MILKIIAEKPDYFVITWDSPSLNIIEIESPILVIAVIFLSVSIFFRAKNN
jgi:hypothetical protein